MARRETRNAGGATVGEEDASHLIAFVFKGMALFYVAAVVAWHVVG